MLIVYPLENCNTFISEEDATAKLTELGSGTEWALLTPEEKETALVLSAAMISAAAYITSPGCYYANAQVMLIHADLKNDGKYMSSTDQTQKYTKAEVVGVVKVEYNIKDGYSDNLPGIVKGMLHDCLKDSSMAITRGFTVA